MSTQEIAYRKREERARKKELDDAKIAMFSSQFRKEDKKIRDDEDSDMAVEYYVDERGDVNRNVYFKNAKENLEPLRKVEAQGYRYEEMLSPEEKELAYGLYKPLPKKMWKKLGYNQKTIKAGRRIRRRLHKKTRKGKGKCNSKGKGKGKGKKTLFF